MPLPEEKTRICAGAALQKIHLARKLEHFKCPKSTDAEHVVIMKHLAGDARFVGVGGYSQDIYTIGR